MSSVCGHNIGSHQTIISQTEMPWDTKDTLGHKTSHFLTSSCFERGSTLGVEWKYNRIFQFQLKIWAKKVRYASIHNFFWQCQDFESACSPNASLIQNLDHHHHHHHCLHCDILMAVVMLQQLHSSSSPVVATFTCGLLWRFACGAL